MVPQASAIRNVLRAIQSLKDTNIELVINTSQSAEDLTAVGITGPRLRVEPSVKPEVIPQVLSRADALLLPFCVRTKINER